MQKSNDNEIVQYLGVKHVINYLEVQVGLTQTLHFQGCLQYDVWGIWGRWGFRKPLSGSVSDTYVHTYADQRLPVEMCMCACQ